MGGDLELKTGRVDPPRLAQGRWSARQGFTAVEIEAVFAGNAAGLPGTALTGMKTKILLYRFYNSKGGFTQI